MNKYIFLFLCLQHLVTILPVASYQSKGNDLICYDKPIDLGIVFDSSVSISTQDFIKAKNFLRNFLSLFAIGPGYNDTRVSIIPFGRGIYRQDAFDLDNNKHKVLKAIERIPHHQGNHTDTGLAIQYMRRKQLARIKTRRQAERVCLVFTDGESQDWSFTGKEAKRARRDGIKMFALGVGLTDKDGRDELLRIAGSRDRVFSVKDFDSLETIRKDLAKTTCFGVPDEPCGKRNPADIEFFFSPIDLSPDDTSWSTTFITHVIDDKKMDVGFRYGANTGTCPHDRGFDLNRYNRVYDVKRHISYYDGLKLPSLITEDVFKSSRGGRHYARDVAVIFYRGGKGSHEVMTRVQNLVRNRVQVFIANPAGHSVNINGATALSGSYRQQAEQFIIGLCSGK